MFTAGYEPPEDVQTFRLYFKSDLSPDFYYIDRSRFTLETRDPVSSSSVWTVSPRRCRDRRQNLEPSLTTSRWSTGASTVCGPFSSMLTSCKALTNAGARNPAVAFFTGGDPELVIPQLVRSPRFSGRVSATR